MTARRSVVILGTRGIPAAHGGFETFAENLSQFLVGQGWHVAVYCQHEVETISRPLWTDQWQGIDLVHVEVATKGPLASLDFDWRCTRDAARRDSLCLVLGYNSAVFLPYLRAKGRTILTNMDGIEWQRPKWGTTVRGWFWLNEWIAAWTSHRLIADHPAIADHLATRRGREAIVTIPYGGVPVDAVSPAPLAGLRLDPDRFLVSIARIEPDNSILEIVQAFSRRRRGRTMVVLGRFDDANPYHRAVRAAAGPDVVFPGAIYDSTIVQALRFHARAYVHGHVVGGTNPSLVEALWAGSAVIAHDNRFNRWTAGPSQFYFGDVDSCDRMIAEVLEDDAAVARARRAARERAAGTFGWEGVLRAYEREFLSALDPRPVAAGVPQATNVRS